MADYSQLPGTLNLWFVRGDEMPISATFNVDLTGYTLSAAIFNETTQESVAIPAIGMTTATTDGVTSSTVTFNWTEAQTQALATAARYRWFFRWVSPAGVTRTVLAGQVRPRNP